MKKILLTSACFLFCLVAAAQDISLFTCDSKEACVKVADSLLRDSKRQYKLLEAYDSSQGSSKYYRMIYKEVGDTIKEPLTLSVLFEIVMVGANIDLEIIGVPSYEFYAVHGKYLDIFPIWVKYIDPTADINDIAKKKYNHSKEIGSLALFRLSPDANKEGYWKITGRFFNQ